MLNYCCVTCWRRGFVGFVLVIIIIIIMTSRDSLAFGSSDNDAILSSSGKINTIIAHSRGKE